MLLRYIQSDLQYSTGGEESSDTDSDADLDEDTPINTRSRFRVPQNDLHDIVLTRILHMIFFVFIFSAGTRRYRSRVKVPGIGS